MRGGWERKVSRSVVRWVRKTSRSLGSCGGFEREAGRVAGLKIVEGADSGGGGGGGDGLEADENGLVIDGQEGQDDMTAERKSRNRHAAASGQHPEFDRFELLTSDHHRLRLGLTL